MSKLRFGITMSLDGYVAGPRQSVEHPLGEGGERLHDWAFAVRTFRRMHGMEGGATGVDDDIAAESLLNVGATIMGRHIYLGAGLIDEMEIHVVPVMLGGGARLFEHAEGVETGYECVRVVSSPSVAHFKYVLRRAATEEVRAGR